MPEAPITTREQALQTHIAFLTKQIDFLCIKHLQESQNPFATKELAELLAKNVIQDARTVEAMALVASIAAKTCHMQALSQKNSILLKLTGKSDHAAQLVYDYTLNQSRTNNKKVAKVRESDGEETPKEK